MLAMVYKYSSRLLLPLFLFFVLMSQLMRLCCLSPQRHLRDELELAGSGTNPEQIWINLCQPGFLQDDAIRLYVRAGPVFEVVKWIKSYAGTLGLTREQTFVKKEATAEDIILLIRTLWQQSIDIPCAPIIRIAFHLVVLLSGIGGFRPGCLMDLKYSQIALDLMLDSKGERRLVATFTIYQNKQRTGTIRQDQANILSFSAVLNPKSLFCPVSLVIARALADQAFNVPTDSLDKLMSRPNLEDSKRLRFKWKDELLDRPIFPIDYHTFGALWNRTTLVAGYPERTRPYSLRVGAANRLDGVLEPALRNYILSHSSGIFQRSYQARQLRQNLLPILSPEASADDDLFALLRQSSLDCDSRAPIYVKRTDIDHWEHTRNDLRQCAEQGNWQRRSVIIRSLSRLLIDERRRQYFQAAGDLRARGQAVDGLAEPHQNHARQSIYASTSSPAEAVASLLGLADGDPLSHARAYIERLVAYQVTNTGPPQPQHPPPTIWPISKDEPQSTEEDALSEPSGKLVGTQEDASHASSAAGPSLQCTGCPDTPRGSTNETSRNRSPAHDVARGIS
ncbi:hypothetical protein M406DRAFT_331693 [Cryphonectria parasitica EP155]|uniref:Uncharacterized protein n=1 Tax=Cryphonectria parasitica (strain ATCC 38755 / EP155) TaxID=660469 RepID=A0A9P5CLA5_CRYP1|nr:uncharacterized protein M406DRAFT_331693 [Cryphonectria parasitica EP155]KAF3763129.1 hypothetical protein M406DRAFT_331693 [Cryphonectria parasitica EP155]